MPVINVVGGGLAGCEAAYHIAQAGLKVIIWEMRPEKMTLVHSSGDLAELVCSNSLKSQLLYSAQGLLKEEMRFLNSLVLQCAYLSKVPAGSALAVDRKKFSELMTAELEKHPNIEVRREEIKKIPEDGITIVASGPLTSEALFQELARINGEENQFFFDAVAPSVTLESLDQEKVFKASRYDKGMADYYNCPLSKEEYERFYEELLQADIHEGHSIDRKLFFSACMPIEVMARRGIDTLRFGPLRPVGLTDPRTGKRAWAIVQLRQENQEGTVLGLVGCQTRLKWKEQDRIFRLIPGLEKAEFVRYGVMHRNSFINSPRLLLPTLQHKDYPQWFFAGQITGVEGYMESAATGILAGINAVRLVIGKPLLVLPPEIILGALVHFITTCPVPDFQPVNANFGILPPLGEVIKDKKSRYQKYVERSLDKLKEYSELYF